MNGVRIALIAALALLAMPAGAQAAFPGANGKIAYTVQECDTSTCDFIRIYSVNPDGSGRTLLTSEGGSPAWSADGAKIAFESRRDGNSEIYVMDADGANQTRLTNTAAHESSPTWAPGGDRIAFSRAGAIWSMEADGMDATQLTNGASDQDPAWSPDGSKIAFVRDFSLRTVNVAGGGEQTVYSSGGLGVFGFDDPSWAPDGSRIAFVVWDDCDGEACGRLFSVRADGANLTLVEYGPGGGSLLDHPAWSPDGAKIAFAYASSLYSVNPDGSGDTQIPTAFDWVLDQGDGGVDWQPLPVNTPSTYARPKAATPVRTPLVPAHAACTSPNRVHGGSLSYGSCSPPQHLSPTLTVGVGDGSPAFSRSVGWVQLTARPGVPGGVDDADMAFRLSITNVMRKSDLSDYTGELGVDLTFQMTDREGAVGQTSMSSGGSFTAPCTATESTIDGATCAVNTTVEALIPNAITEGARAIFELGPIRVRDGGPDENADTPADDGLLATQGVFVP